MRIESQIQHNLQVNKLSIDASTVCQLRCPACSTSKGIIRNGIIGAGFLSFANFKMLVDENPSIMEIELSNWGEIFLNPELIRIVEYAYKKHIKLTAGNGVNFNSVSDEMIEALVKYQFGYINMSIDGTCQETYCQYRVGGNYNQVIENIEKLNYYKDKYNSKRPMLSWQFIIFGHNEHELPKVKELCKELNMKFNPKLNHSDIFPVKNKNFVRIESGLGVADRNEYKMRFKMHYKRPCCQCLVSPQINWNGDVLGCCVNKWEKYGNLLEQTLDSIINGVMYQNMLSFLFGQKELDKQYSCYHCPNYENVKSNPLNQEGLEQYINFIPAALKNE
jgi:MoaA/NifB/PqqE/SkfB family radical SAM enzyme